MVSAMNTRAARSIAPQMTIRVMPSQAGMSPSLPLLGVTMIVLLPFGPGMMMTLLFMVTP